MTLTKTNSSRLLGNLSILGNIMPLVTVCLFLMLLVDINHLVYLFYMPDFYKNIEIRDKIKEVILPSLSNYYYNIFLDGILLFISFLFIFIKNSKRLLMILSVGILFRLIYLGYLICINLNLFVQNKSAANVVICEWKYFMKIALLIIAVITSLYFFYAQTDKYKNNLKNNI